MTEYKSITSYKTTISFYHYRINISKVTNVTKPYRASSNEISHDFFLSARENTKLL